MNRFDAEVFDEFKKYSSKSLLKQKMIKELAFDCKIAMGDCETVLDLGCGSGFFLKLLDLKCKVVGVDYNSKALDLAKAEFPLFEFVNENIIDFFPSFDLDCVTCFETLEHVQDFEACLKNVSSYSNRFVVSVPDKWSFRIASLVCFKNLSRLGNDRFHCNEWSVKSFKRLLEKYFENVSIKRSGVWIIASCENKTMI